MKYTTLLFDVKNHVAHITLNRPEALNAINLEWSRDLMYAILQCDEDPAVNGYAVGAGMSLALACDIVLAARSACFSVAYTRVGLTPDGSMSYFLPRTVGLKRALELTLTNRMLAAEEAFALGIVSQVVPDEELLAQANQLAMQLASGPAKSFGAAKRVIQTGWD